MLQRITSEYAEAIAVKQVRVWIVCTVDGGLKFSTSHSPSEPTSAGNARNAQLGRD